MYISSIINTEAHTHMHMYIYTHTYIYIYTNHTHLISDDQHTILRLYTYVFLYTYIFVCVYLCIYTHPHIYTNTYVYSLIHSPMHTHIRIHTHTHIYTHIHTIHTSSATTNLTQLTSSPRLTFCCSCPAVDKITCEFSSKFFCVSRESTYDLCSKKIIFI